jgi:cell division protein FtsL
MKRNWFPLWLIPVLLLMAVGTVWLRLYIVRTTYSIHESDKMIHELQQAREQMQLRVTALRSPRKLEILARTRFGLTQPRTEQIVHLSQPVHGAER